MIQGRARAVGGIRVTRSTRAGVTWTKASAGDGVSIEVGTLPGPGGNVLIHRGEPPAVDIRLSGLELRCLMAATRDVVYNRR